MPLWAARRSPMRNFSKFWPRRSTRSPPDWSRYLSVSSTERVPELIQTQPGFDQLVTQLADELATEPLLAVDTEAASFHRFRDRVYLVQLSSRSRTAIVDPLAVGDLGAFGRL